MEPASRLGPGTRTVIVAGLAVAVGLVVWVATGSTRDGSGEAEAGLTGSARLVTEGELAALPDEVGHAVYWAGGQADSRLEVSSDGSGNVHLRYLTGDAEPGSLEQTFLDVGTYPFTGAYTATRALAATKGVKAVRVGDGIGFMDPARPYSVILAWPSQPDLQVEVYHPEKRRALEIVRGGDIVPVP